jgi:hypothetical protein
MRYRLTQTIMDKPMASEGIPRVIVPVMVPVMASVMPPGYSAESSMRCCAFDARENLPCELCRD